MYVDSSSNVSSYVTSALSVVKFFDLYACLRPYEMIQRPAVGRIRTRDLSVFAYFVVGSIDLPKAGFELARL